MNEEEFHKKLKELANLWLKEFNLKSLENDYIPNIPKEVKDYIGNLDMKITQGSFLKLLLKNREYMISFIKPTIENPNCVLDDGKGILFIKEFTDKNKNIYFMSVARQYDGEWIFASHTRREFQNIQNKIKASKIIINKGFERDEVAGARDILESGGEVSKPSHLQIKYIANQDFGTNPDSIVPQNKDENQTRQSSLDSLNERFTQALEEHKQNQRERYGDSQEQDNNSDSTESKKSYKRSRK